MGKRQFTGVVQRVLQHGMRTRLHALVGQQQLRQDNGRHVDALLDGIGIEIENAMIGSEQDVAVRRIGRSRLTETDAGIAVLVLEVLETPQPRCKLAQSVFRTDPQLAFLVFLNGQQDVRRQTVAYGIGLEACLSFGIQVDQLVQSAAEGCHIQFPFPRRFDPMDIIIAQCVGFSGARR